MTARQKKRVRRCTTSAAMAGLAGVNIMLSKGDLLAWLNVVIAIICVANVAFYAAEPDHENFPLASPPKSSE